MDETSKREFEEHGYIKLPGLINREAASKMQDLIWQALFTLHGIARGDRSTWKNDWTGLKTYKNHEVFEAINDSGLKEEIDLLLGVGNWEVPDHWGGFLTKFPQTTSKDWSVARDFWHTDYHYTHDASHLFGVRVFIYLSEVKPRGGGTLVVRNSHRLVHLFLEGLDERYREETKMSVLRDRFNVSDPWLSRLTDKNDFSDNRVDYFMACDHVVNGVPVRVCELTGECGDVFLMHPWLVHSASDNASDKPRFMRAKDITRTD